ncbi:MAG: flagellar basal body protein [Planctomycetota bacterium]
MLELGRGVEAVVRVLDAMALRANVIAHNVANQNTPGFKRFEVVFEEGLREAFRRGDDPSSVVPTVRHDMSGPPGVNNVSTTQELAELDKVRLLYDLFSRRAAVAMSQLNRAIQSK